MTTFLDCPRFAATPLVSEPYEHVVVENFVRAPSLPALMAEFPPLRGHGSFPTEALDFTPLWRQWLGELEGEGLRAAIGEKFGIDLTGRPTMITLRGLCDRRDGEIHTDSRGKIITLLIYLNAEWPHPGGRLRILRSGTDLEDYASEHPPLAGTLLAFRRGENSWHGHKPHEGQRRILQLNYVTDAEEATRHLRRHKISAFIKRINPFAGVY